MGAARNEGLWQALKWRKEGRKEGREGGREGGREKCVITSKTVKTRGLSQPKERRREEGGREEDGGEREVRWSMLQG